MMTTKTPCGLCIPIVDKLRCLEEFSTMVTTYNEVQSSSIYVEDHLFRLMEKQPMRDLADRVTHASEYWLDWHDQYCDCRREECH